jgi:DNA repair protein RadC
MSRTNSKQLALDEGAALTQMVRENLALLTALVQRHEVARQIEPAERLVVRKPADVADYLGPEMADLAQEQLRVLLLDIKNRLIGAALVYQGGANAIVIRLADCFREAVRVGAAAIVLAHNHPSHDPDPSEEDVRVTREAAQVGDLLGIELLDHIVLGTATEFVSLRERGFYRPLSDTSARSRRKTSTGCCRSSWETSCG